LRESVNLYIKGDYKEIIHSSDDQISLYTLY